jgi:hypothetical protein
MSGETKEQKTLLESFETGSEKIDAVIKTTNATLGWMDTIHKFIAKNGFKKLIMDLMAVFITVFIALFMFQPGIFVERFKKYEDEQHEYRKELRTNNTPLVQEELDKLREQYNVSWAAVWELHNSTNNLDGLPFLFATLTYESMNPALTPIAQQFDEVRLSLHPLSTYLEKNEIWCGHVDELKEIDVAAYYRAKALNIEYLGFKLLSVDGEPKAVLSVAFVEGCTPPDFNKLKESCYITSYKIGGYLTLTQEQSRKRIKTKR